MEKLRGLVAIVLLLCGTAYADTFEVCWMPPTTFENGDPLLEGELDYYTLYVDEQVLLNFDAIVGTWCATFEVHVEGTYFASMTVTHINGQTSQRSNIEPFTLGPRAPAAPTQVVVQRL
jgi:hypothetical protein